MRNNSLAMLATITGIGILAWWIGFFDPTTCTPNAQQDGWTSCENIARERNIALVVLVLTALGAMTITLVRRKKK
jgi:hypothetical protein